MSDCLFCKIIAGEIPSKKVFENKDFLAFEDINPQAPVHILFISNKHIETLNDISDGDAALLGSMLVKIKSLAGEQGISEDGYRLVINCNKNAGQEVFHLHVHLLGGRKFTWPPG